MMAAPGGTLFLCFSFWAISFCFPKPYSVRSVHLQKQPEKPQESFEFSSLLHHLPKEFLHREKLRPYFVPYRKAKVRILSVIFPQNRLQELQKFSATWKVLPDKSAESVQSPHW